MEPTLSKLVLPKNPNSAVIHHGDRVVGEFKNLRMRRSVLLLADAFRDPASASGIQHAAIGSGIGQGTLMLPTAPHENATQLRQEQARFLVDPGVFDDLNNAEGDTITNGTLSNRVIYTIYVPAAQSEFLITEVGLFGGFGSEVANGGIMAAWITFPVIDNRPGGQNADAPEDLTFTWRFDFPFINPEELRPV